jgi:hypothetical protein
MYSQNNDDVLELHFACILPTYNMHMTTTTISIHIFKLACIEEQESNAKMIVYDECNMHLSWTMTYIGF